MSAAVPVALCGKSPAMASGFIEKMKPEYDIVAVYHSVSAIKSELPSLLQGTNVPPQSGLGSNSEHPQSTVAPKAIVVGAGFSNSEFDEVKSIAGGEKLAWLKPDERMIGSYIFSSRSTMLGKIADRAKKVLGEKGEEPGVWQY